MKRKKGNPNWQPIPPTKAHRLPHRLEESKRSRRKAEMRNAMKEVSQ